jgi:RimJ/RimL family protein N-acetyltransferase
MIRLEALADADLPEVMRIERTPGYEGFVGAWTLEEHAAELASPDARYFGVRDGAGLAGFIILQQVRAPEIRLRRIAVAEVNRGLGTQMLRAIMDWVFETTSADAMTLGVALANGRGKHVYERAGWTVDGEDAVHFNMRIDRATWATLRGAS